VVVTTVDVAATEEYNGTSWATSPGSLNTARRNLAGAGTQTAALGFGGAVPVLYTATEEYNGSSWTSVNPMNTARYNLGGVGIQTAALAFGGATPPGTTATEEYNGTSWATSPGSLNTARVVFRRSWNTNCRFRFWGTIFHLLQEQLKNTMEHLGQQVLQLL
jgi:hypothetical protein